ncbi:hypothetical protein BDR07DRAFT_1611133 [Suillus spraguei]|nr:hypothetical protein BDR07DRAFT_1611133 [Suillus spraguei]
MPSFVPTHQESLGYTPLDIFIKHPMVGGMQKVIDDVLVLSSGEKTVTTPIENSIAASPYVNGTAIFGRGRNHVGIFIEPRARHEIDLDDEKWLAEFRNGVE